MKHNSLHVLVLLFLMATFFVARGWAQDSRGYELLPSPDIWYNDVDGIRAGVRVLGQVPGTFEDGPHRLNAGIWVGTWLPEHPVSYYARFTEPIPAISGFNSEGSISLTSSIRTGLSQHGLEFNKRWQQGFDETHYLELAANFWTQKQFDQEYLPFPNIWQQQWLWLGSTQLQFQNESTLGRYRLQAEVTSNFFGDAPTFTKFEAEAEQHVLLGSGFEVRGRLFAGLASDQTAPEFLFGRSFVSPDEWLRNALSRAKGTIPYPWMQSGIFQIAGGANLRGYSKQDIDILSNGGVPLLTSVGGINIEVDYPNPLDNAIRKIPVIGNIVRLRSYLFLDSGTSLGVSSREETRVLSDAGLGFMFSLNIPDFRGNARGIMLRYDVPFWLSNTEDAPNFKYRNILGIGTIFRF